MRRLLIIVLLGAAAAGAATGASGQGLAPAGQEEFVPISELPEAERLPAAPLLLSAYAAFWLGTFAYLWSIRRRLAAADRDLAELRQRVGRESR